MEPSTMLECRILTSEAEIEALAEDWRRLHAASKHALFTDYDWFNLWWRYLGKTNRKNLHIAAAFEDGRLAAVLPLVVASKLGMRILEGAGLNAGYPVDVVGVAPENPVATALWDEVRHSRRYDFAYIENVEANSACSRALAHFAWQRKTDRAMYLHINEKNGAAWLASLSSKLRNSHKRSLRRINEGMEAKNHTYTALPLPFPALEEMMRLKKEWCIQNSMHGMFDQNGVDAFHQKLMELAAAQGKLAISWTQKDNRFIAGQLGLVHRDIFYGYFVAHDPAWNAASPGSLSIIDAIMWAADHGIREFDFMMGDSLTKRQFSSGERHYLGWAFSNAPVGKLKMKTYFVLQKLLAKRDGLERRITALRQRAAERRTKTETE